VNQVTKALVAAETVLKGREIVDLGPSLAERADMAHFLELDLPDPFPELPDFLFLVHFIGSRGGRLLRRS